MKKKTDKPAKPEIVTTVGQLMVVERDLALIADMELGGKARYHVARLLDYVLQATAPVKKFRAEIIAKIGSSRPAMPHERAEHGTVVTEVLRTHPEYARYTQELDAMLEQEVTLPWGPVSSAEIPAAKARQLVALGPLCQLVEPSA